MHFILNNIVSYRLWDNAEEYFTAEQAPYANCRLYT